MKRFLSFLIVLCVYITSYAQTEHVKFMGIPIDGTINQFQQKLKEKGVTYNQRASQSVEAGVRLFKGKFADENAYITVLYDKQSKIVYSAAASFELQTKDIAFAKMKTLITFLNEKYVFNESRSTSEELHFLVPNKDCTDAIGDVMLYYQYNYEYDVHLVFVQYLDFSNGKKYMDNQ